MHKDFLDFIVYSLGAFITALFVCYFNPGLTCLQRIITALVIGILFSLKFLKELWRLYQTAKKTQNKK